MPRAPRTRIPDVLAQLQAVNAQLAAQEAQNRQLQQQNRINKGRLVGTLAGAGIAMATGNPLPVVAAAANLGGQVGGAARGGQVDPVALAGGVLMGADALDRAATAQAQRDILQSITPSPAVNLPKAGIPVPATGPIPGLGGAPLPPSATQPDAYTRLLQAAQGSPNPLATAAAGLNIVTAMRPPKPEFMSVSPGATVFNERTGQPVFRAPADADKTAEKGKQEPLYDVVAKGGQQLVANAVPLEAAKAAAGTFPGSRIRKFDATLETDKDTGKGGTAEGGSLKSFEIFDPGALRSDAEMSVARTTGRSDIFDLLKSNAGAINADTLAAVGELPKREIQKAYLQRLEDFAKSNRPAESIERAKGEIKQVKQEITQYDNFVGQAKAELAKAKTDQERKAIFAQAAKLGITRGELE